MKRALLAAALLACSVSFATGLEAQSLDPNAALKAYATRVMPRCQDAVVNFEPVKSRGPANFTAFVMTVRSTTDTYCGAQKYVLYSPKTSQVVIGQVIPLPSDPRPTNVRVSEEASRLLSKQV